MKKEYAYIIFDKNMRLPSVIIKYDNINFSGDNVYFRNKEQDLLYIVNTKRCVIQTLTEQEKQDNKL